MYEEHFGLTSTPFGAKASGAGVFVGPQQAQIMNSLTKGLGAADAVVTVTGPVGVGKTTIVGRALESISPGRMVAWVGRMHLAPEEVLELLLTGFGVSRHAKGTIQRFAAFRRLLAERAAAGAQVAIVVEDAHRIGEDALIELEALTAADAGDATSANIILMGTPDLNKMLAKPELARIRQRNRLRQSIDAFSQAEVAGYLKHCIREAGGDYDAIFDSGVANIVYKCSEGVPRVINTLCKTAMTTAMQDNQSRVSAATMRKVAAEAFGFEATQTNLESQIGADAFLTPDPVVDTTPSEAMASTPAPAAESGAYEIPELIEDTHPVLEKLDVASTEIEATQTQKTLLIPAADDAASDSDTADNDAEFSLDDALSVEADETNVMPGITPNLDQIAARVTKEEEAAKPQDKTQAQAAVAAENIPTLSNSMRIDVEVEVKRAKEMEPDSAPAAKAETARENARKAPPESKSAAVIAANPASPPDATIHAQPEPIVAVKPEPAQEIKVPAETKPVVKAAQRQKASAAVAPEPVPPTVVSADPKPIVAAQPEPTVADNPAPELKRVDSAEPPAIVVNDDQTKSVREPESTVGDVAAALAEQAADAWSDFEEDTSDDSKSVEEVDVEALGLTLENQNLPVAEKSVEASVVADVAPAAKIGSKKDKRVPDIDALEAALSAAKKGDFAAQPDMPAAALLEPAAEPMSSDKPEAVADVPEITLEDSLPQRNKDDDELRRVAEQIGSAKSLEDFSDDMAETIFGSQAFDDIAAAVVANPPPDDAESPVMLADTEIPVAANDANDGVETGRSTVPVVKPGKVDESAAKRLNMVKAMNNGDSSASPPVVEEIEISSGTPNGTPAPAKSTGPKPEPIENQINTSMTQTLKALSSAQIKKAQEPEEEEKKSGGLFSRFRRSS